MDNHLFVSIFVEKLDIMSYDREVKEIFEKHGVSENQQEAIKKLAENKFELGDHEERLCALGFIEGYALCIKAHSYYDTEKVFDLVRYCRLSVNFLNQGNDICPDSHFHFRLKNALSKVEPVTYFNFPEKMEVTLGHLILYCRKLEKDEKGKGYSALQEIAPATNIYDAVMACLKYPDAKVEFKGTKYCGESDCRESEFANGYCKKHANI